MFSLKKLQDIDNYQILKISKSFQKGLPILFKLLLHISFQINSFINFWEILTTLIFYLILIIKDRPYI
jgi:hypothetical protein